MSRKFLFFSFCLCLSLSCAPTLCWGMHESSEGEGEEEASMPTVGPSHVSTHAREGEGHEQLPSFLSNLLAQLRSFLAPAGQDQTMSAIGEVFTGSASSLSLALPLGDPAQALRHSLEQQFRLPLTREGSPGERVRSLVWPLQRFYLLIYPRLLTESAENLRENGLFRFLRAARTLPAIPRDIFTSEGILGTIVMRSRVDSLETLRYCLDEEGVPNSQAFIERVRAQGYLISQTPFQLAIQQGRRADARESEHFYPSGRLLTLPQTFISWLGPAPIILSLTSNLLRRLPNLNALSHVKYFILDRNKFQDVPNISGLTCLVKLSMMSNSLTSLANLNFMDLPTSLTSLELPFNQLTGDRLRPLRRLRSNLRQLVLDENPLGRLPEDIFSGFTGLDGLYLRGAELRELPPSLSSCSNLRTLRISGNELINLPPSLSRLTALRDLDASDNRLGHGDEGMNCLSALTHLTVLNVLNNNLTQLPNGFSQLVNLIGLFVGNNNLVNLPSFLLHFPTLRGADFSHNRLAALPDWFVSLLVHSPITPERRHIWVNLVGNPLPEETIYQLLLACYEQRRHNSFIYELVIPVRRSLASLQLQALIERLKNEQWITIKYEDDKR